MKHCEYYLYSIMKGQLPPTLAHHHDNIIKISQCCYPVASSPGFSQILSRSRGEKSGAWYQYYVTDWKWWTWLVRNVDSVS